NRDVLPEEEQIAVGLGENEYTIEPNEKVTGYYAFVIRTEDVENIQDVNVATISIPEAGDVYNHEEYSYEDKIGSSTEFTIVIDDSGIEKVEADGEFYKDRTNTDNMGNKTMVKEKTAIGKTETVSNSKITLEGYQFTEFEPNEHEAPRFESFDTGIILMNIKLEIE